jgi:ParB-like chromosome segregation protein Spo0J
MKIKVSQLKTNPNNPRVIRDQQFKKLVKSIKDFPEMLAVRKLVCTPDFVVLGGNMRLKALQEAGIKEVDVEIVNWDESQQKQFIIKDNLSYGEWDWEMLANEWDFTELSDWGMNTALFNDAERIEDITKEVDNLGLPEFAIADKTYNVTIHFETEEERDQFVAEKEITISKKGTNVWSAWWPEKDRQDLVSLRYE